MWQRFTEKARKIVFYSQEEAQAYGEGYVSTEHLLLGILRDYDCTAMKTLEMLSIDCAHMEQSLRDQLPRSDARPNQDMTLTPRAKRVIDLAYDEARNLNNDYIGTEHLLLGLIKEGGGLASRTMESFGIDLEIARKAVMNLQDSSKEEQPKSPRRPTPTKEWNYQMTMNRVKEWATWAGQVPNEEHSILDEITALRAKLDAATSEMQRNQLLALCLELSEGGSLENSENWKNLRLTKEQAEAMVQIGAELRKLMDK